MNKVYAITIEDLVTDDVKCRGVYSTKASAMKAFKMLEKIFANEKDPLGLSLSVDVCRPNDDGEYVSSKTLITAPL